MSVVSNNILAGASGQGGGGYEIERSLRFNSGDSAYLNRTPSAAGNRKTWTWSSWVKRSSISRSGVNSLFGNFVAGDDHTVIRFDSGDKLDIRYTSTTAYQLDSDALFRDPSAWYHIVVAFDTTQSTSSDRVKAYVNGAEISLSGSYPPQNSDTDVNAAQPHEIGTAIGVSDSNFDGYLADVHFIDGQALAPTDFGETDDNGVWQPKKYTGNYNISNITYSNYLSAPGGFVSGEGATNAFDGSTSTRAKLSTADEIITFDLSSLSLTGSFEFYATNATSQYSLDGGITWTSSAANTYTTATSNISGVSNIKLKPSSGTTMKVTAFKNQGTILVDNSGANSFHLDFADNSSNAALGTDTSSNGNTWTVNNLSVAAGAGNDSLVDSPTNGTQTDTGAGGEVVGNYATWSPLDKASNSVLTNGNLDNALTGAGISKATIHVSSGKWYWEISKTDAVNNVCGIATSGAVPSATYLGGVAGTAGFTGQGLFSFQSPFGRAAASNVGAMSNGDILGFALDCDNGTLKLYINNVLQTADHFTFTPGLSVTPAMGSNVARAAYPTNFGQRAFAYTAPSGYKSLNTANLSSTIADGSLYFDTNVWNGDGTSNRLISTNFSPDFTWMKIISQSGQWHLLANSVIGGDKTLSTNNTNAENTRTGFVSFDSDGFTIGDGNSNPSGGEKLVGWAWDAGTSTVSNTDGSITSQVRANPSAGFSIVSWTASGTNNDSVGHGLNDKPEFYILKSRDGARNWLAYTDLIDGSLDYLNLNLTAAKSNSSATLPTSSVFYVYGSDVNTSGEDMIAYCFAPVEGYSSFGSYTGNGSADGPFVFTGFRPAWLLVKRTDAADDWWVYDSVRGTFNTVEMAIAANTTGAELNPITNNFVDLTSSGFKFRGTGVATNASSGTYIYAAFAEHPFASNGGLAR